MQTSHEQKMEESSSGKSMKRLPPTELSEEISVTAQQEEPQKGFSKVASFDKECLALEKKSHPPDSIDDSKNVSYISSPSHPCKYAYTCSSARNILTMTLLLSNDSFCYFC